MVTIIRSQAHKRLADALHQLKVSRARRKPMLSEETPENMPEETPCVAKARFCEKCKVYVPIALFVSNDGTDESTLCNRHQADELGLRYCKGCGDFVALDLFSKKQRIGFVCKKHFNLYAKRVYEKDMLCPVRKRRRTQWERFCRDSRFRFKHAVVGMSKDELEVAILKVAPINPHQYAAMPIDARLPTTSQNIICVTLQQRVSLMKLVDKNNLCEYAERITEIQQ